MARYPRMVHEETKKLVVPRIAYKPEIKRLCFTIVPMLSYKKNQLCHSNSLWKASYPKGQGRGAEGPSSKCQTLPSNLYVIIFLKLFTFWCAQSILSKRVQYDATFCCCQVRINVVSGQREPTWSPSAWSYATRRCNVTPRW